MRQLNEDLSVSELNPSEFLLALAKIIGFHRMIDFLSEGGDGLYQFSPSIGPMIGDFKSLALLLTINEEEDFRKGIESFLGTTPERELGMLGRSVQKTGFIESTALGVEALLRTYPEIVIINDDNTKKES